MVAQQAKQAASTVKATPLHVWRGALVGLGLAVALAYGHSRYGVQLVGTESFLLADRYVFFLATVFLLVFTVAYYHRVRDVSEAAAVLVAGLWAVWLGWVDIWVYLFVGKPIPEELPWLMDAPPGIVAGWLGMETVTGGFLKAFVLVTFALLILVVAVLSAVEDYGL